MAIVNLPLTVQLANGTVADATQVMTDLNQIATNVNANAAGLSQPNTFTQVNTFQQPISGVNGAANTDVPLVQQVMMLTGQNPMAGPDNWANGADIASAGTINLTTATGNFVRVTGTTTITAITLAQGYVRFVQFTGILTLTNGSSLQLPGAANITTAVGDWAVFIGYSGGIVYCAMYQKASGTAVVAPVTVPRSYLAGLVMSTAGSSSTMTVAAGQATSSDQSTTMTLAASLAKTTSAWVVGAGGGLDTGSISASTTYHWYLIERPDTGVVDIAFSLSAAAPTTGGNIPVAYTKFRRIGSMKTDGSSLWTAFDQFFDTFRLRTPVLDASAVSYSAYVGVTLSIPTGIVVQAFGTLNVGSSNALINFRTPNGLDGTPSFTVGPLGTLSSAAGNQQLGNWLQFTNTSAQISVGGNGTGNSYIATDGWVDTRGREL